MDRSRNLAEGSVGRHLLDFSVPAIVGLVAQALYYATDRLFVGRALGRDAIAGMTVAFPFMLIVMAFGMLIGFGAAALVSIRLGQQRKDEAEQVLGNAATLLVVASVLLTFAGLTWLDRLLILFGASPEVLPYARDYLQVIVLGAVFQLLSFGLNSVIRGEGSPRVAMVTMLIGVLLNVAIAPILIFVFGMGMRGAAIATVASQAVSTVWVVWHFFSRHSHLKLRLTNLRLQGSLCASILAIGSPHCTMQLAASVLNGLLNNQLRTYGGDAAISVMGIIWSLAMLFGMPIFGINQGAQPIIGYNYGARRYDRVKRALQLAVLAATGVAVMGFLIAMLFPREVVRVFEPRDATLAELGTSAIRVSFLVYPLIGFQMIAASYFQAVGKPKQAMLLMLSRQVLILIPLVLILPRLFGLSGVWAALPAADLSSAVVTATCLVLELRQLHKRHAETAFPLPPKFAEPDLESSAGASVN